MTIRIAAGFLAILATDLVAAPVETSGGAFAGAHSVLGNWRRNVSQGGAL